MLRILSLFLIAILMPLLPQGTVRATGMTYYVSSSQGNDSNAGTSQAAPFASISKINSLSLQPGDSVLFRCGDSWRGEMLRLEESGAAGAPITVSSYPANCAERPILSGSLPINGWRSDGPNRYVADLDVNVFPLGINQLFRNDSRLPIGRWPNIGQAGSDNGYSTIDGHSAATISDNELPAGDWSGAIAHIKGMRWYILNRQVVSRDGTSLNLNQSISCYEGCSGWGYWLSNHLLTLDSEGEWYYDRANRRVYLFSSQGLPAANSIEGSVVMNAKDGAIDDRSWGGITLGRDLQGEAKFITVENLELRNWYRHGISTPTNYANFEANDLIIRNNLIRNPSEIGISLRTWVYAPKDGREAGWRGGYNLLISNNTIIGANRYGVLTYSRESQFVNNTLQDISLIANLTDSGMGCDFSAGEGGCTQDGTGFMVYAGNGADSGHSNLFAGNILRNIGYNGWLVFGHSNTIRNNVISDVCLSKGDCAGIRPFGDLGANPNPVREMIIEGNIISGVIGNTDGAIARYKELFGFGINPDYSANITVRNNVIYEITTHGILYKASSGTISGNLVYNAGRTSSRPQITVSEGSQVRLTGNVAFALNPNALTIAIENPGDLIESDNNYFFHPYRDKHLSIGSAGGAKTFAEWQSLTGRDANSRTNWYRQNAGEASLARLFVNPSAQPSNIGLSPITYVDLDQAGVASPLSLAAYSGRVLVKTGEQALLPSSAVFHTTSAPSQTFTLRNGGSSDLAISEIRVSAGFRHSHTCPASLAAAAECQIEVAFSGPSAARGELLVRTAQGEFRASLLGTLTRVLIPLVR